MIVFLIVWNFLITIGLLYLLLREFCWSIYYPKIEFDKEGIWFGWYTSDGSGSSYRIISWRKK